MPASLTPDDAASVALLARLKLSDEELAVYTSQLGTILEYVEMLDEVDTADVEPMVHAVELANVFREDVSRDSLPREAALANAPRTDGRYFLVPDVLGRE